MTLNQLHLLLTLSDNNFNLSKSAEVLCVVQSAASKQLHTLESELGISIFERKGKRLIGLTEVGKLILQEAQTVCLSCQNIKVHAQSYHSADEGEIRIATTHTQAKYVLPQALLVFKAQYPKVSIHIEQASPKELVELLYKDKVDVAICTEKVANSPGLKTTYCQRWHYVLVVPKNHPLARYSQEGLGGDLTLKEIADYPILTYIHGFSGSSKIHNAFLEKHLTMNIGLAAADTDIIKTYVKLGFGVGIIAETAYDERKDTSLVAISLKGLLPYSETKIASLKNRVLPAYITHFTGLLISLTAKTQ